MTRPETETDAEQQVMLMSRFGDWRRTMWLPKPLPPRWFLPPAESPISFRTAGADTPLEGPPPNKEFGLTPRFADGLPVYWEGWSYSRGQQTILTAAFEPA